MSGFSLIDRYVPPVTPSSVLYYYHGTGFDNKNNPGTNDATEVGTVPQPAGGPIAGNWLAKGALAYNTDYISLPPSPWIGLTEGCLVFHFRIDSNNPDTQIWMVGYGLDGSTYNDNFYSVTSGGTVYMQRTYPPANQNLTLTFASPSLDVDHLWRIEFGTFGLRVYIDGVLTASDLSGPWRVPGVDNVWDAGSIGNTLFGGAFPWTDSAIDGFMLSNDPNEVYPPVKS